MKAKVKEGTRIVWSQETRQVIIELEDGTEVWIRQMEDDNGVETCFTIEGEMDRYTKPHLYDGERSEEFVNTVQYIANGIFLEIWDEGIEFDWDSVEDPI